MNRFEKLHDGKYVNHITGEIMTLTELSEYIKQEKNILDGIIREVSKESGSTSKKDTHIFGWSNNNGNATLFTKNYKVFQRKASKDMGINEIGLMAILSMYLESETNKVVVNGLSPSNQILENLTGLGTSTLKKTLSSLRDRGLLITRGRGLGRDIFVNPFWSFDGKDLSKETAILFNIK